MSNTDSITAIVERLRKDTIARIRKFVRQGRLSKSGLALKAGLSANTLRYLDRPSWEPTDATLDKCMAVINQMEAEEARPRPTGGARRAKVAA